MGDLRRDLRGWWEHGRALTAANPLVVDVGIALLVLCAMTMPFVVPRAAGAPPATWGAYGLSMLTVVPLVWRRRAPLAVLFAVIAANALYGLTMDGPGQPLPYTGLVVVYTIAALSPARKRLVTGGVLLVAVPVGVGLNTRSARELTFSVFVFAAAYVFGRLTDARQRAHRVEAEQAAARERARIAREMHDILSHAVSLMIVQAEAGPVAVRAAPERAEAAFDAISAAGRDAMAQLRHMLGVLREGGDDTVGAPREPQPGLAALPGLLDRVRGSGLAVVYRTVGDAGPVADEVGVTVFRVVQEALTNVVKHAGAHTATVQLRCEKDELEVLVADDGRGANAVPRRGGHGLVGICERAAAHGGSAAAGPGADGRGFEVRVRIPLSAAAEVGS
ncbi:sensor histidine kinase [Streptomyces hawaiiensis]|jgi:signal transduction histidine kinase|uniref:histidine kinase n=1 Tax=Streptomyces hawaiiensis TaxID=67305 RepID=A0A6G5RHQ2_9ACTN|nr:histidine kinase [Streptomyces hawaiiensis]QCD57117.1 sensor histidine kinase [Streptomyces hawaiiensis]